MKALKYQREYIYIFKVLGGKTVYFNKNRNGFKITGGKNAMEWNISKGRS